MLFASSQSVSRLFSPVPYDYIFLQLEVSGHLCTSNHNRMDCHLSKYRRLHCNLSKLLPQIMFQTNFSFLDLMAMTCWLRECQSGGHYWDSSGCCARNFRNEVLHPNIFEEWSPVLKTEVLKQYAFRPRRYYVFCPSVHPNILPMPTTHISTHTWFVVHPEYQKIHIGLFTQQWLLNRFMKRCQDRPPSFTWFVRGNKLQPPYWVRN